MTEEDYDVVLDTLQKQRDILWKMTQQNMNSDSFNIMDQIRLEQIDQLDKAMAMWKNRAIQPWWTDTPKIHSLHEYKGE